MIRMMTLALGAMMVALPAAAEPYGTVGTIGPAGAPIRTCAGLTNCVVRGPTEAWQSAIESGSPGKTVLLRYGTYNPGGTLDIPTNVTVANYNGKAVKITGPISFGGSGGKLEGITVRIGSEAGFGGILIQSLNATAKVGIVLSYLDVAGATGETIRVRGNVTSFFLTDSLINGQNVSGHAMKVRCDDTSNITGGSCNFIPQVSITNNLFQRSGTSRGKDLLQMEGAGNSVVFRNEFTHNPHGEDCVDWKPQGKTNTSIDFSFNYIHGCRFEGLLMHQSRANGRTGIEGNRFDQNSLIRRGHSGTRIINNWFTAGQLTISASHLELVHNTFTAADLKFGDMTQGAPQDLAVANNIFSGTHFSCGSVGCGTYNSIRNVRYNTTGSFSCQSCISADPLLTGYVIGATSPARDTASNDFQVYSSIGNTRRPQGPFSDIGAYEIVE